MGDGNLQAVIGRRVSLPGHFADPVVIESLEDYGDVLVLRVRTHRGEPKDATIERAQLTAALAESEHAGPQAVVDPARQFLLVESHRIRLAYAYDPHFAVSLSGIEALPHQLEAVYGVMLPQPRLRFLLADDPGAGKTIMGGLLFKELKLRHAVERALILAPAPLALQWQDEMRSKFDELFELVDSHIAREQLGGSPWARYPQCVASMDFAKQEHIAPELLRERWDLVIIDESHKMSMPEIDKPTMRFKLARQLAERTDRLLLLTATPHQGNPAQFRNLMSLLDEHVFRSEAAVQRLLESDSTPWLLRRMKEDLRDFEGRKLFVQRHAHREDFSLTEPEWVLYREVTDYINKFLPRQKGRKKQSAALARMVFQRRLASSLRAIRISLERRMERLQVVVDELHALPEKERIRRLHELASLPYHDPEAEEDDETEDQLDDAASQTILAERYDLLMAELDAITQLVDLARRTEALGKESKLDALFRCLARAQFDELKDKSGKLLIFTEQRATLEYLREKLVEKGYAVCEIHGGMDAVSRKAAQREFHREAQICIATDAAGEGINLQFCHLMINYDMPWNPNRLEQRMGRIHRFGQEREVHVFNFVAVSGPAGPDKEPVVEGRILQVLLAKLDEIRHTFGDRVFDVVGLLLRTNKLNLEEALRDATYNPKLLNDYTDKIERLSAEKLNEYEKATGIALAKRTVDLRKIRGADFESEEKRLMPEYVEDFFLAAAGQTGLRVERRANPHLLRIEHVSQKFLARNLVSVRTRGEPDRAYAKASFRKDELRKKENLDGELLSPGHPLYSVVDEVLGLELRNVLRGAARYVDPRVSQPHRVHFFELEIEGESLGDPGQPPRTVPIHSRLVAVEERPDGTLALAQPDVLHDLTPIAQGADFPDDPFLRAPDAQALRLVEGWIRARVQHELVTSFRAQRTEEVRIRREFLTQAFDDMIKASERRQMDLHARVMAGENPAKLARDNEERRLAELAATKEHRVKGLDHLAIVRSGRVALLGTALVSPPYDGAHRTIDMVSDPEVEAFAYELVKRYEASRGWTVEEVWKLHDGSGFDMRSVGPPDEGGAREVRRIEVKGRGGDSGGIDLTPNEWRQAQRLGDTYWLYVVWGAKTGAPRLKTIRNPWARFRETVREIVGVRAYAVDGRDLERADGTEWRPE